MATYRVDEYKTAQGVATTPLTPEEQAKDDLGFTHPHGLTIQKVFFANLAFNCYDLFI